MTTLSRTALQSLQGFGLSEPEISVYLALLELGTQPASVVARKAGLKRGHTYNVLSLLMQKGVVQEFEKKGVRTFTCTRPAGLLSLLERREEGLEGVKRQLLQSLPFLESIINPLAVQPKVRFYQGIEGIKQIYEDTLRFPDNDLYALGDFEHYFPRENSPELNDWMWDYCNRRAKAGIRYIGIVNKSPTTDLAFKRRKGQKRTFKMLRNVDLPVEVNIYGDRVAIISSSKDMVGLIIEDKPTADTLRHFHQAVWKMLPDYVIGSSSV
ncbi:MAG: helix-turn-helix domain-containing protein [Candidatus Peribacteraceae bacterium]|nr:helix-turn-helix domain-containing protein [Candidatus Peribacteraceae bacterium]